jgi:hypothetical protein
MLVLPIPQLFSELALGQIEEDTKSSTAQVVSGCLFLWEIHRDLPVILAPKMVTQNIFILLAVWFFYFFLSWARII